ncbi:MAG: hypothetical protein ACUVTX_00525 [Bacteroidales bacterium]
MIKKYINYDKFVTGFIPGIVFPVIIATVIFLFSSKGMNLLEYYFEILKKGFMTHGLTLCVAPDIIIFFVFNYLDMLKSARGMLGATIVWVIFMIVNKLFLL